MSAGSYSTKIGKQTQPSTSTRNAETAQMPEEFQEHPEDGNQKADEILGIFVIFHCVVYN